MQWGYPFSLVRRLVIVFALLTASTFVGAYVLAASLDPALLLLHILPVALAVLLSMYVAELVGVTERPLPPLTIDRLFWSIATACIVMALGYAIIPTYAPSTLLAALTPVVAGGCVYLQRKWAETRGVAPEDAVLAAVFAGSRADAAAGLTGLTQAPGVRVRGIILPARVEDRAPMAGLPVLTPEQGLVWYRDAGVSLFLVANASPEDLRPILAPCAGAGCVLETVDSLVAQTLGKVNLDQSSSVDLLARLSRQASRFSAQRALDLALSLAAAPLSLVFAIPVALAVKLSSPGPILFRQRRVGRWGREFFILKFRTMRVDAEKATGPVWAQENDPRVTPIGRLLRRSRLDEIPQLWNVIRGDMSLVGPRPERPFFVRSLRDQLPLYDARQAVRPGVTGWAQIRYSYGSTIKDAEEKLAYELFYILHRSFTFYFAVLLETTKVLLFRKGAR